MRRFILYHCLAALSLHVQSQIVPDEALQRAMQIEETAFLQSMKPGLQHTQMLAIRAAMCGDEKLLQQIRMSRNVVPSLPQDVDTFAIAANMKLFRPSSPSSKKRPILLYLHGGGWCFGSINSCSRFCAAVALKADCIVVALNYRLAPQCPYPASLDDCREAFYFIKRHAIEWGGDTTRVSIGGDSAGGNLAISTAMLIGKGVVRSVIPIYPVTELFTTPTHSWTTYAKGYGDDAELLEAFNEAYANGEQRNPFVSVGLATDEQMRLLPPVLLLSAGHDILYDQTANWAKRLKRLHHSLDYHVFPTATHLFITVPGQPTAFNKAVEIVAQYISRSSL